MKYVRLDAWPPDHAKNAYEKGFFVEALQVLHAWIELQAKELLIQVGCVRFSTKYPDTWDSLDELDYKDVVRSLYAIGQLTEKELTELLSINSARNKMIHRIFKEPHQHFHRGFPEQEYERVFKAAMTWAGRIYNMVSDFKK